MPITLSYPKPRDLLTKTFALGVTDSSTEKGWLPAGAVPVEVTCNQTVAATTNPSTWLVGWASDTDGLLNAFASATTKVGQVHPGTTIGSGLFTKLTADQKIISTCTAGASDTTSVVVVTVKYFVAGPGEEYNS